MEEKGSTGLQAICDPIVSFSCFVNSSRGAQEFTQIADVLPVTSKCDFYKERWYQNDLTLERYWSPEDGIGITGLHLGAGHHDANQHHESQNLDHLTYGEVTPLGVRQLAFEMGIARCKNENRQGIYIDEANDEETNGIVFYDLGSGVGRLVAQMYLDQPGIVSKAIGVELDDERHWTGIKALEDIMRSDAIDRAMGHHVHTHENVSISNHDFPIQLIHGDATKVDLDDSTTHVFISSLCFPENVVQIIEERLLKLPNIRVVAALNRLDLIHRHREEWQEKTVPIQMTWGPSSAKIYRKVSTNSC